MKKNKSGYKKSLIKKNIIEVILIQNVPGSVTEVFFSMLVEVSSILWRVLPGGMGSGPLGTNVKDRDIIYFN